MPSQIDRGNVWSNRSNSGPPDFEDLVKKTRNRLYQLLPSAGSHGVIALIIILVLTGIGAWTAYYTVPSDSVAVVQRFGKYLKNVQPGLHFKLPLGIDSATIVF